MKTSPAKTRSPRKTEGEEAQGLGPLGSNPAAMESTVAPNANQAAADAELLRLGEELRRAMTAEEKRFALIESELMTPTDEELAKIKAPCSDLADRIWNLPATTFQGLGVKALALVWCRAANYEPVNFDKCVTTDERVIASITRDAIAPNFPQAITPTSLPFMSDELICEGEDAIIEADNVLCGLQFVLDATDDAERMDLEVRTETASRLTSSARHLIELGLKNVRTVRNEWAARWMSAGCPDFS